ncbi:glutaredoxin 3 [Glaciecola sp. XM2]|jgi:glutaredoxin 3|uniref:glutaredoxin 3 n=1 Tax=Glaciecola sp. XM2 TaxID=1914931 RepID=UPI001BDEA03E|nr:glutaredoxin 3 [Glaciecola sp. XM2]MBT1449816.1 glutaredoxin 3 [Glaciecola sp. XM2]
MQNVEIYTKDFCPYCSRAKALLAQKGVEFTEYNLLKQPNLKTQMVERANGGTTVPQIFIGDRHIGGCDDLFALEFASDLDGLLNA